ncbi:hypothetical protein ACHAW5_008818 [Stephanodiscus triporus]|uniref:Subtilisin n=1 Tax=Stephanodiscus triporus TaxID=2934178 RepID=A0ABD3MYB3_9STRA
MNGGGGVSPPTSSSSSYPTSYPSVADFYYEERTFATQLYITEERAMDDLEKELYVGIMEDTTGSIGVNITSPFITTACTILDQQLGSNTDGELILQVTYAMNYSTHYGYEVLEYPEYFRSYMNGGGDNATLDTFYDVIDVPDWDYISLVGPTVFRNFTPSPTYESISPSASPSSRASASSSGGVSSSASPWE